MEDMLYTVNGDGPVGLNHVQDAFDPKQVAAMHRNQRLDPFHESVPVDRLVIGNAETADLIIMPVHVVMMVVSLIMVMMYLAMKSIEYLALLRVQRGRGERKSVTPF